MRKSYHFLILFSLTLIAWITADFLNQQKKYPRVRSAIDEKYASIGKAFRDRNMNFPPDEIFIRIFKWEKMVELWAKASETDTFCLIKSYPICSSSGTLGPKRKRGDLQVPEGFYHIARFNPHSAFYLSLGINYPNASDRILGEKGNLGGDIFIHGNCVTIGCIPITDDGIKELYLATVYAKDQGQVRIPVHIFPTYLNDNNFAKLRQNYSNDKIVFWRNLQEGYLRFRATHKLPKVSVNSATGKYVFDE